MGAKQIGLRNYKQTTTKMRKKKKKYLAETDQVVTKHPLLDLIEPVYPKTSSKGGHPPYPLATMLRIHLKQR